MTTDAELDLEVQAITAMIDALSLLDGDMSARARVLWFVAEKYNLLDSMLTMAARRYQ